MSKTATESEPDLETEAEGEVEVKSAPKPAPQGHNSSDQRLRLLIERVERLTEERACISDDIKDVFTEAKAVGYDPKIMRIIIRLRKMREEDRRELEAITDTYKTAVGLD